MVRATLYSAGVASLVGAISQAILLTILNSDKAAWGHMTFLESLGFVLLKGYVGAWFFVFSLLFSLALTIPVSVVTAICAYPFLDTLETVHQRAFAIGGFAVGVLVGLGLWWSGSAGNAHSGSAWLWPLLVGGPAGLAAGIAFARHLPREDKLRA